MQASQKVKFFLKKTAAILLMALSFALFAEAYFCKEGKAHAESSPVECCVQCCPRHHMAPPTIKTEQSFSEPVYEKLIWAEHVPVLVLLIDSVFHPPRA